MIVLNQDHGVGLRLDLVFFKKFIPCFRLKRAKPKCFFFIAFNDKINTVVAKIANPIEQYYWIVVHLLEQFREIRL